VLETLGDGDVIRSRRSDWRQMLRPHVTAVDAREAPSMSLTVTSPSIGSAIIGGDLDRAAWIHQRARRAHMVRRRLATVASALADT
jgi:hypothetical protein